ncbi:MAG: metallopeptidase [Lachnospiraceae bacterium]|nr:metallopeptidase [Lachnospiraceae bacterium]
MEKTNKIDAAFEQVTKQILQESRNELYLGMRYLDLPLRSLKVVVSTDIHGMGTDGFSLVANPKAVADWFCENRRLVNRLYLHQVLHCLLRHMIKNVRPDGALWQLSCDIAVESIMDGMQKRCIRTGVPRLRMNWYDRLHQKLKVLTAENVYRVLSEEKLSPFDRNGLIREFCLDDHSLWPGGSTGDLPLPPPARMLDAKWRAISEKTASSYDTFGREESDEEGALRTQIQTENRPRMDYRTFLRKFAALKEEMQVDPDSFDYVFYSYGLSLYKNMPLIEPQEVREVRRIEEFVIVLDVSMSTSGELVKNFLEQTYSVLSERESYLHAVHIHILQADDQVQHDDLIENAAQLKAYINNATLYGGGGTDFRPAFAYVRSLIERKAFHDLRGMIYFTDGRGIYPAQRPPWETAFVFMEEEYTDVQVPPWAIKLVLEKPELEK